MSTGRWDAEPHCGRMKPVYAIRVAMFSSAGAIPGTQTAASRNTLIPVPINKLPSRMQYVYDVVTLRDHPKRECFCRGDFFPTGME